MKVSTGFVILFLFAVAACNNGRDYKVMTVEDAEKERVADGATETTVANPKFNENKIHGLGLFKIGGSVDSTIGILRILSKYRYDTIWSSDQRYALFANGHYSSNQIIKLTAPQNTLDRDNMASINHFFASWCKLVESYYINQYELDGLLIKNIKLIYYRNKLVSIVCEKDQALTDAIASKFGKPDKHIANNDSGIGPYYSDTYLNGDVEAQATSLSGDYKISVHGVDVFLEKCSDAEFAAQDTIDKAAKAKGLKNL